MFISTPSELESRQLSPIARAVNVEPPHLPATSTTRMSPQNAHNLVFVPISPMFVRNPLKAKNNGNRKTTVKSSNFPVSSPISSDRWGMIAPNKKAPKMAWMPMRSVARADTSTPMNSMASMPTPSCPWDSWYWANRATTGRTTTIMKAMNRAERAMVRTALSTPLDRAMATTTANMHQAVMSLAAAAVRARVPSGDL